MWDVNLQGKKKEGDRLCINNQEYLIMLDNTVPSTIAFHENPFHDQRDMIEKFRTHDYRNIRIINAIWDSAYERESRKKNWQQIYNRSFHRFQ